MTPGGKPALTVSSANFSAVIGVTYKRSESVNYNHFPYGTKPATFWKIAEGKFRFLPEDGTAWPRW